jgi:hypothetical protein
MKPPVVCGMGGEALRESQGAPEHFLIDRRDEAEAAAIARRRRRRRRRERRRVKALEHSQRS